jgi:methyl-accepting chemotaxis protein
VRLQDIRIGKRLAGSYIVFIALIMLLSAISFKNMRDTDIMASEITNINFHKTALANTVLSSLMIINKDQAKAVYTKDKSPLQNYAANRKVYIDALDELRKMETEKEGKEMLERFKASVEEARESNGKMNKAMDEGNFDEALAILKTKADPPPYIEIMRDLVKYQENGVQAKYKEIVTGNRKVRAILLAFVVVALGFGVLVSVAITRSIALPIQRNISVSRTLADGNLLVDAATDRKDEFGDEMRTFGDMVGKWKRLISEVKSSAARVASASHQLSASADQLARGGAAQVERTIQVSTASEEMSQASLDIAKNANSISESAKDMVQIAENGNSIVNRSVMEVKEIAKTVRKSSELVKDLGSRSEKIGEIVSVINEIADQTNLLALNAAIEAARAGEAGRGFAVVADEVKKLAERTSKSTQEIGDMIGGIKTGVEKAVESMDEASGSVKTGVELSGEAGGALVEIVNSATSLQSMVQQIAAAIEEMNSTTDEIAKDIEQVASVTKDASISAEQVTQAALELSTLSVTLEDSVKEFEV